MQSGAQNGVMGDADEPTNLPVTELPEEVVNLEKQMASYSVHPEYLRLKEFLEGRIKFFGSHLPDGRRIQDVSKEERDQYWVAACVIIAEFQGVIEAYTRAREDLKSAGRQS